MILEVETQKNEIGKSWAAVGIGSEDGATVRVVVAGFVSQEKAETQLMNWAKKRGWETRNRKPKE